MTKRERVLMKIAIALICFAVSYFVFYGYVSTIFFRHSGPYKSSGNSRVPSGGSINVSGFAFRDFNRNGIYDLSDHSMGGVGFRLVKTSSLNARGRTSSMAITNLGGWANFQMSASQDGANIGAEGTYQLIVLTPPGMQISSGNQVQEFTVTSLPGAIGDLTIDEMPKPVGFMPDLWIMGAMPNETTGNLSVATTLAESENQSLKSSHSLAADKPFLVPLENSAISLFTHENRAGTSLERTVSVGTFPVVVSTIFDLDRQRRMAEEAHFRRKILLDFEELIPGIEARKVPSSYAGLSWDNITAMHDKFSSSYGYHNATASGHYLAYTSSGQPGTISNQTPFDFIGGVFGIGRHTRNGEMAIIEGYEHEKLIYRDEFPLSAYFGTYFQADYLGITRLRVKTRTRWQLTMDDLVFRVPED